MIDLIQPELEVCRDKLQYCAPCSQVRLQQGLIIILK